MTRWLSLTSNSQKYLGDRQSLLNSGDRVYLYGDTNYTGTLIRPVERTYPHKWTVELDRGSYEAVNVKHISLIESQPSNDLDLPFDDAPEPDYAQLQQLNLNRRTI